ncbi:TolC family protein [Fusobacteria bacterium ZRK30]|nr:TolC family protein [Fusobacteria bacterium ZRK30]
MKKLFLILLLLSNYSIFAKNKVTLEEAIDLAYKNNYKFKNIQIENNNIELEKNQAYKEALPYISYRGTYITTDEENQVDLMDGTMTDQGFFHEISLNQPIYNGGMIVSNIKIADIFKEIGDHRLMEEKSRLKLAVITKYSQIVGQKHIIRVYEEAVEEVEFSYRKAQRELELEYISNADYLPLKSSYIDSKLKLSEAKNQLKIYLIEFENLLGLSPYEQTDVEEIKPEKYSIETIDLKDDLETALENSRESKIINLDREITEERKNVARADLLPEVNAKLAYNADDRHFNSSGNKWYWTTGIEINWRLFDFGKNYDSYSEAKNEVKKAENKRMMELNDLEVKIRRNYIELIKTSDALKSQDAKLEATQENFRLQKKLYSQGQISTIEYLIYENQLNNSKLSLIQANLNYYIAYEKYREDLK